MIPSLLFSRDRQLHADLGRIGLARVIDYLDELVVLNEEVPGWISVPVIVFGDLAHLVYYAQIHLVLVLDLKFVTSG